MVYNAVKVGNFEGNARQLAMRYNTIENVMDLAGERNSDRFFEVPFGLPGVHKYGLLKREGSDAYIIMLSTRDHPERDFNTILTVTGSKKERAEKILEETVARLRVEMRPAPEDMQGNFEMIEKLFNILKSQIVN